MSTNLKWSAALVVGFVAAVLVAVLLTRDSSPTAGAATDSGTEGTDGTSSTATGPQVVRENSHRLSDAGDDAVTLVEFLDFECEACGAAYPFVEELREAYDGQVTFVMRYFPIPSHRNAENAAVAVEAAAQQGQLEAMYKQMYDTQAEWGEQQDSRAPLFRSFAEELGLDMTAYDAAVEDPATLERVVQDREEGVALGVEGTPTFFLDGELIQPESTDDFRQLIDDALAG